MNDSPTFRRLYTRRVFDGRFRVVDVAVEAPDGEQVVRQITEHPGAVTVVALDSRSGRRPEPGCDPHDLETVVIHQYRAAVDAVCTELPAGTLDIHDGEIEDPAECARRELIEEVGLEAANVAQMGEYWVSPGWTSECMYVCRAFDLRPAATAPQTSEEAHMTSTRVRVPEAIDLVRSGTIRDAKSIVALSLLRDWLEGSLGA